MKPTLQFRLSQHLTLTPQLQQSIRLLQLSTIELNQEIERLLMENPILEREDGETDAAAAVPARRRPPRRRRASAADAARPGEAARRRARRRPAGRSAGRLCGALARHGRRRRATTTATARRPRPTCPRCATTCNSELALTNLSARDRALVALLVDALDEDGYLTQPLEEIAALMSAEAEVSAGGARDRAAPPAEPRARRRRRAHARRVPGAADPRPAQGRAGAGGGLRAGARDRRAAPRAAREPRLRAPEAAHRRRRRRAARGAAADPGLNPRPGAAFAQHRDALRGSGRGRAQGARRLAREPEPGGDAAPARQPPVRRARRAAARQRRQCARHRNCRRRAG